MKILVTGAAGFIGSHVAEFLAKSGHLVHGLDNFSSYYAISLKRQNEKELIEHNVIIFPIDIRNQDELLKLDKDYDYIFHLAAQPGLSATSTFKDYFDNNFIGTKNILDFAVLNEKLKLLINISTSSVYGLDATMKEEFAPQPASDYGVTKLAAEQLALSYSRNNKLQVCSLRLYSVYGPRERPDKLYPKLIESLQNDSDFSLFEGSDLHLRSYTYIDDITKGITSVIGKESIVNGAIFNIGNSEEYTTKEGIEIIEKLTQKKIKIKTFPKRAGDQLRTKAIIEKAQNVLGYSPKINLEEGLSLYIKWYHKKK